MTDIDRPTAALHQVKQRRSDQAAPTTAVEFEQLEVWPDEIKIGDVYGGFVVTGVHLADHYRAPAVRLTIFTDPNFLPEGVDPEEFGRFVLMTDRDRGHRVPIDRPRR